MDELSVSAGGVELFVRAWGEPDGRPMLCWPGAGPRGSGFMSEAGPLLAQEHGLRVLALDAPGFGRSPPVERRCYEPGALVELIPPLAAALGLDRYAFAGFSWGGDLGCHLAARHPDSLAALVLLDAGYRDPPIDPSLSYEELVAQNERRWEHFCGPSWQAIVTDLRTRHRRWSEAVEESYRAGWTETRGQFVPNFSPHDVAAIEYEMVRTPASTTLERLARSRVPVLLVTAEAADEKDLERFAADVPQAEIVRAQGAGHDVLLDGGADLVHALGRWLEAHGSWRERPFRPVSTHTPSVTLYHAPGCHLCDRARSVLMEARAEVGFELVEVDITGSTELEAEYREWLPVVEIDGERAFVYHVDSNGLRRKLARASGAG